MRCFLGFDLTASLKMTIEQWRQQVLPPLERPVPAANFHITSVFLGQVTPQQQDSLVNIIDVDDVRQFSIRLTEFGYWPKPKILWLGTETVPIEAQTLHDRLVSNARSCGLTIQERLYRPHVTLMRKVQPPIPAPLLPAEFEARIDALHLFESVSTKQGVRYPIRTSWPLRP